jgi:hypothetical protein
MTAGPLDFVAKAVRAIIRAFQVIPVLAQGEPRMRWERRQVSRLGALVLSGLICSSLAAQAPVSSPVSLTCAEMETFLKTAKMGRQRSIPVGVTLPSRATLDDGKMQHDASIQTIDESKTTFATARGTELNFRDSWQFNVAGYELAKMLELNMVPPYVERTVSGRRASVSWWVGDTMMERDRVKQNLSPPDTENWNAQVLAARAFHELIADTDVNMTNLLITRDWRIWLIDFSRAFRTTRALQEPQRLNAVDRKLLARLKGLTKEPLRQKLGRWVNRDQIDAVLARRDLIVRTLDAQIAANGEPKVVYDLARASEPCGTGLQ